MNINIQVGLGGKDLIILVYSGILTPYRVPVLAFYCFEKMPVKVNIKEERFLLPQGL
jgi:hypothetical protein